MFLKILKLTLVLALWFTICLLTSSNTMAQESTTESFSSYSEDEDLRPVKLRSTRFDFDIGPTRGTSNGEGISFTTYTLGIAQELTPRWTVVGRVPFLQGQVNGKGFSEIGNGFVGTQMGLIELQEYHPLWLTVHGGVRFSRPEPDVVASAKYQEYHSGLTLTKQFRNVEVITDGNYIQKNNEDEPGLDVGNELRAYGGIKVELDSDWTIQGGYLVRHADPLKRFGEVVVQENLVPFIDGKITFHLSPMMDLMTQVTVPTISESVYGPKLLAFGDISTQATVGRSWFVAVIVGL